MRIKKVSQSIPIKAKVVNSYSESEEETYSCDYVNEHKQDKLTAGDNITITDNTISATNTTYNIATTTSNGLMSSNDKTLLNNLSQTSAFEHKIGTYGTNDLYRIREEYTQTSESQNFPLPMSNYEKITNVYFSCTSDNGGSYVSGAYYVSSVDFFRFFVKTSDNTVQLRAGKNNLLNGSIKWYFTFEYTKSTN